MDYGSTWLAGTVDTTSGYVVCDITRTEESTTEQYESGYMCGCTDCTGNSCHSLVWKSDPCDKSYSLQGTGITPICAFYQFVEGLDPTGVMGYLNDDEGGCAVWAGQILAEGYFCP